MITIETHVFHWFTPCVPAAHRGQARLKVGAQLEGVEVLATAQVSQEFVFFCIMYFS